MTGGGRHLPVMPEQVLAWLQPHAGRLYVDATVGYAGHAEAILRSSEPDGRLVGIDRDEDALQAARLRLTPFSGRVRLIRGNFADLALLLGGEPADGFLFDVGVSSAQLDQPERGFSYRVDAPLDMRMDPDQPRTAADLVNQLSRSELADIIARYGEERWAARIAAFIVQTRERRPLATTGDLVGVIRAAVPAAARRGPGHPARRTFQALRIAVNGELDALTAGLAAAAGLLHPGGRVVAITFHSLEDRIVKQTFARLAAADPAAFSVLTRKVVRPSPAETAANPRARSARLRVLERPAAAAAPVAPPARGDGGRARRERSQSRPPGRLPGVGSIAGGGA